MKKTKIIIALVLVVSMLCSINVVAFAEGENEECKHESREIVTENIIEATNEEHGSYDEVTKCSNPDCNFELSRTKNNILHKFTDYLSNKDATCTEDGTKTAKCSVPGCDKEDTITDEGSALEHDYGEYESDGNATCTEDGTKTRTCQRKGCEATEKVDDVDSALGHDYVLQTTTATCVKDGYNFYMCSRCKSPYSEQQSAFEHSFTNYVSNNDATCLKDGTKTAKCDRCDETDKIVDVGSALGHNFTNYVSNNDATCTNNGTQTAKCDRCDETSTITDEESALGHDYVLQTTTATCVKNGYNFYVCSRCESSYSEHQSALGHSFTNYVSDNNATCVKNETQTAKCDRCDQTDTREISKSTLGHNYVPNVVAPTCTEKGYTLYKCSRCSNVYKDSYTNALGHTEVTDQAVAPTCTTTGLKEGKHCSVCKEILVKREVIKALGHTEEIDQYVAPTCTTTGLTEGKHCSVCNTVLVEQTVIPATGHTEVTDQYVAPTCTTTGLTEGKHCSVCNEITAAQNIIPALGHKFVEGVCPICGVLDKYIGIKDVSVDETWYCVGEKYHSVISFTEVYANSTKYVKLNASDLYWGNPFDLGKPYLSGFSTASVAKVECELNYRNSKTKIVFKVTSVNIGFSSPSGEAGSVRNTSVPVNGYSESVTHYIGKNGKTYKFQLLIKNPAIELSPAAQALFDMYIADGDSSSYKNVSIIPKNNQYYDLTENPENYYFIVSGSIIDTFGNIQAYSYKVYLQYGVLSFVPTTKSVVLAYGAPKTSLKVNYKRTYVDGTFDTFTVSKTINPTKAGTFKIYCTKNGQKVAYTYKVSKLIKSVSAASGAVTVKWEKAEKVTGYQIQVSTKSNMSKAKTVKVSKSASSKKISGLKKKTKYYVRVRAVYSGGKYSKWSNVKSVKTK